MTRLESSAWPLAGGSACVFALAVVLDRLPWQAAFVAVGCAVGVWAWLSPLVTGAAIGGIAWMCVTGFDVQRFGEIRITGSDDAVRAAVLVLAGVLVAAAHATAEARARHRRPDPVWADFHQTAAGRAPGDVMALAGDRVPRQYDRERSGTARAAAPRSPAEGPGNG